MAICLHTKSRSLVKCLAVFVTHWQKSSIQLEGRSDLQWPARQRWGNALPRSSCTRPARWTYASIRDCTGEHWAILSGLLRSSRFGVAENLRMVKFRWRRSGRSRMPETAWAVCRGKLLGKVTASQGIFPCGLPVLSETPTDILSHCTPVWHWSKASWDGVRLATVRVP